MPLRSWLGVLCVLMVAAWGGSAFGVASGKATAARAGSACAVAGGLATWSPSGERIAFVGGGSASASSLSPGSGHALCIAYPDGTHAQPLPGAGCRRRCSFSPSSLNWVRSGLLLYLNNFQIFKLQIGHSPQLLGKVQGAIDSIALDAGGDRVALGSSVCSNCRGPVTVLSIPAGEIVGQIGGPTADNDLPSLSPDGKLLAFTAFNASTGAVVWTASADGSDLQPLAQCGGSPEWSPRGDKILCSGLPTHPAGPCCSLSYLSPQGGPSTTLVPRRVQGNFPASWSPNGKQILYLVNPGHCCRLALVDVQTRTTRWLPRVSSPGNLGAFPQSAAWSPNSRQLLVTYVTPAYPNCVLLYRIAANGGKPHQIRNCP
jgi:hypothetical protein